MAKSDATKSSTTKPKPDQGVQTLRLRVRVGDFAASRVIKAPGDIADKLLKDQRAEKAPAEAIRLAGIIPTLTELPV